jgi:hypothetical protein
MEDDCHDGNKHSEHTDDKGDPHDDDALDEDGLLARLCSDALACWGPIDPTNLTEVEIALLLSEYGIDIWEIILTADNAGVPVYKQLRGLGNASPYIEGVIGAGLQYFQDVNNPNLTPGQIAGRTALVGLEYGLTDLASLPVAALGEALGAEAGPVGAVAGYVGGNLLVTEYMDTIIWPIVNTPLENILGDLDE